MTSKRLIALEADLLFLLSTEDRPLYSYNGRHYCYIQPHAEAFVQVSDRTAGILVVWSSVHNIVTLRTAWHWFAMQRRILVRPHFYGVEHWGAKTYRQPIKDLEVLCNFHMHETSLSEALAVDLSFRAVRPADHVILYDPNRVGIGGPDKILSFDWSRLLPDLPAANPAPRRRRRRRQQEGEEVVRVRRSSKRNLTGQRERRAVESLGLRRHERAWLRKTNPGKGCGP